MIFSFTHFLLGLLLFQNQLVVCYVKLEVPLAPEKSSACLAVKTSEVGFFEKPIFTESFQKTSLEPYPVHPFLFSRKPCCCFSFSFSQSSPLSAPFLLLSHPSPYLGNSFDGLSFYCSFLYEVSYVLFCYCLLYIL